MIFLHITEPHLSNEKNNPYLIGLLEEVNKLLQEEHLEKCLIYGNALTGISVSYLFFLAFAHWLRAGKVIQGWDFARLMHTKTGGKGV